MIQLLTIKLLRLFANVKIYIAGALFTLFCLFSERNRDKLARQIHGEKSKKTSELVLDLALGSLMWPMTLLILLNVL
jgi:hypothetical protein